MALEKIDDVCHRLARHTRPRSQLLEQMFSPFSQPALTLTLPKIPNDIPLEAMLALDLRLGIEYPGLEA